MNFPLRRASSSERVDAPLAPFGSRPQGHGIYPRASENEIFRDIPIRAGIAVFLFAKRFAAPNRARPGRSGAAVLNAGGEGARSPAPRKSAGDSFPGLSPAGPCPRILKAKAKTLSPVEFLVLAPLPFSLFGFERAPPSPLVCPLGNRSGSPSSGGNFLCFKIFPRYRSGEIL
jgi:hypothetical protein